ncbi:chorion class CB protein PC404-like [Plodia interpunctella]|uniref:chorion class CB protein PC404-like n=1 Tax=Plodia interpunctella TaxID=58824 RepID=UPI0023676797|nr:chorion class CB protein PC404-like [Plodia interpunctella]
MASKIIVNFTALAVFIQISLGQVLPAAYASGNSVVENNVVVNSANGLGLANGANLAGANTAGANLAATNFVGANLAGVANLANAASLANANLGVANVGLGSLSTAPGYINLASVSGGGVLPVTSYSPIAPGGLSVLSDNAIEGNLVVTGELPFLSAVAFEGALNTGGAGAASCGCGSGDIGITSENYAPSLNGLGFGFGGGVRGLGGLRL